MDMQMQVGISELIRKLFQLYHLYELATEKRWSIYFINLQYLINICYLLAGRSV